jgi:hypothetical protein
MPLTTRNWKWKESRKASYCARDSIRTIKRGKGKKAVLLRVCCPKGAYKIGRCSRGMKSIAVARRR